LERKQWIDLKHLSGFQNSEHLNDFKNSKVEQFSAEDEEYLGH
jgi:hypothetical protein